MIRSTNNRFASLLLILIVLAPGCGPAFPQVSFDQLRYIGSLHTAINTRQILWLHRTAAAIETDHKAGRIGDEEHAAYQAIVRLAEGGEWASAEAQCVRFKRDQLRQ